MVTTVLQRFDLTGRVALVTGGGSGLGLAMARGLAEAGATVVVNGRDAARLDAAVGVLTVEGLRAGSAPFDVTDPDAVRAGVAAVLAAYGAVDILVNNAGIARRGAVEDLTDDMWRSVLSTNLDSAFYLARAVVPGMKARGSGAIVNTCSVMSRLGRPSTLAYTASKGGLAMLTRGLAVELAPHGIRVNGIAPGYFATDLTAPITADAELSAWVAKRTPIGRWGTPDELAGACVFLASDAASYVTGHVLYADGGLTAGL